MEVDVEPLVLDADIGCIDEVGKPFVVCSNCECCVVEEECFPCNKCGYPICHSCTDKQNPPLICMQCLMEGIANC